MPTQNSYTIRDTYQLCIYIPENSCSYFRNNRQYSGPGISFGVKKCQREKMLGVSLKIPLGSSS